MVKRQALFRLDPGLLFVAAGLALCAAVVLLPAERDLVLLQQQLAELQRQEDMMRARLRITSEVIRELDSDNPDLQRRLIASQLNLAPAGNTPIVLVTSRRPDVSEWVSARVRIDPAAATPREVPLWHETALTRLVDGPYRLWVLGGAVLCVFIGLLHGTGTVARQRTVMPRDCHGDVARAMATASDDPEPAARQEAHPLRTAGIDHHLHDEADGTDQEGNEPIDDSGWEISTYPSGLIAPGDAEANASRQRDTSADTANFPKSLFD